MQFGGQFEKDFVFFFIFERIDHGTLRAGKFLQRCAYFADLRGIYPKIEVRGCSCEEFLS